MERDEIMKALGNIDEKYVLNADREFISTKKSSKQKWVAVASVVVVPLLCATAYQAGFFADVVGIFSPKYGETPPQVEYIGEVALPNGASITQNGITITVDAIMGDANKAEIVYTIANADSAPNKSFKLPENSIDEETGYSVEYFWEHNIKMNFPNSTLNLGHELGGGGVHGQYIYIDDNTLQYVLNVQYNTMPIGRDIVVTFEDMAYNKIVLDGDNFVSNEVVTICEGVWELEFVFDYNTSSQVFSGDSFDNDTFIHHEREVHVKNIAVSPLSTRVDFEFTENLMNEFGVIENNSDKTGDVRIGLIEITGEENPANLDEHSIGLSEFIRSIPLYFTKTDGSTIDLVELSHYGSGMGWNNNTDSENMLLAYVDVVFEEITLLDDIVSITFGEVTTPIEH